LKENLMNAACLIKPGLKLLGVAAIAGLAVSAAAGRGPDPYMNMPSSVELSGTIRDFKEKSVQGGHPDFERQPVAGFGHYVGMVADTLDADGKPMMISGGYKVSSNWKDAQSRNRIPNKSYLSPKAGDVGGSKSSSQGGAATSADSVAKWFRDDPAFNTAKPLAITLKRQEGTNRYVFDDKLDPAYVNLGGFFPINGQMFGNSGGASPNQNFHFTYELHTQFVFEKGKGHVFTFKGDDDVWVFIDGKLVIDLGGVHSAVSQTIELDRCAWLEDGKTYDLRFFFAERHRVQSNFRIETTLSLKNIEPPATAALYD